MPVQAGVKGSGAAASRGVAPSRKYDLFANNTNGAYYVISGTLIAAQAEGEDMNVSIGEHWEKFVETAVREGRYGSASEVVREGLRLVEEREAKLKALREEINAAIESGPRLTANEVSAGLDARMKQWKPKSA
jgi:putative addiction module antidote protein, CC2985 family